MRTLGNAKSVGGAVARGVLRAVVLIALGLIAVSFTRGEPLGNRVFLWSLAALMFALAIWGVFETWHELKRLRRPR